MISDTSPQTSLPGRSGVPGGAACGRLCAPWSQWMTSEAGDVVVFQWVSLGKWSTNGYNGRFSTWIPEVTMDLLSIYYMDLGSTNGGCSTSSLVYLRVPDDELTKSEEIAKQNGENYPRWWEFGLATLWLWHDLTIYTMAMDHRQWEMCWPLRRFSATLWILG